MVIVSWRVIRLLSMCIIALALVLIGATVQNVTYQVELYNAYLPIVERPFYLGQGVSVHFEYFDCAGLQSLDASWYHNWYPDPDVCPDVNVIAVIGRASLVDRLVPDHVLFVAGQNEPDVPTQDNETPEEGAITYHQIEIDNPDKLLGSPAPSQNDPTWLPSFRGASIARYGKPPRVDVIMLHCYGTSEFCIEYITSQYYLIDLFGARGIVVSEFAYPTCWEGEDATIREMQELVAFFRSQPEILGWSWFIDTMTGSESWWNYPECRTQLRDFDTGQLTRIGEAYRALMEMD